jgi:hypothetical protein
VITYQGFSDSDFTDTSSIFGVLTSASDNNGMERRLFSIPCDLKSDGDGTLITISFTANATLGTTNIDMVGLNILHSDFSNTAGATGASAVVNVLDNVNPEITITSPTTDDSYTHENTSSVLSISGTAEDNVSISSVVYNVNTGDAGTASGTSSWNANVSLTTGENIITVTATDTSGNTNTDTLTVIYSVPDMSAPIITSLNPNGELEAGTDNVNLSITTNENATCRYSTNGDDNFDDFQSFSTTDGTTHTTEINNLKNGTSYTYYVKCEDLYGNVNETNSEISFSVKNKSSGGSSHKGGGGGSSSKDKDAPVNISVRINNNDKTTSKRTVTLQLSAKDNNTPIRFQVSNSNNFKEKRIKWIKLKKNYTWTLEKGNGVKNVYVRFKDSRGNISSVVSDSIILSNQGTAKNTKSKNYNKPTVKGVSTFNFIKNIKFGTKGTDVVELQKRLRKEGYFKYPTNTGYFGNVTLKAVLKYQKAHGIDQTGFVGPVTRGSLNKSITTPTPKNETGGITLKSIVNLFLALGIIPKEKADIALAALALL